MGGCAVVGPDYLPPDICTPDSWQADFGGAEDVTAPDPSRLESWWANLHDPILSDLIDQALDQSLDFKQAVSRVREARARRGVSDADGFPHTGPVRRRHLEPQRHPGGAAILWRRL